MSKDNRYISYTGRTVEVGFILSSKTIKGTVREYSYTKAGSLKLDIDMDEEYLFTKKTTRLIAKDKLMDFYKGKEVWSLTGGKITFID